MLNCRQATRLVSQAMDEKLPLYRRLALRFHLLYCVWCRRYAVQLRLLRRAARDLTPESIEPDSQTLSLQAKEQMRVRLQNALKEPPSSNG
ncbi:MAG TPA: zf-HC2 domain-containing protein [Verrucomicrobiae bacterium]|nr:zf-HC2 domain-containing protein [Verrucomicrobiae bacterium]